MKIVDHQVAGTCCKKFLPGLKIVAKTQFSCKEILPLILNKVKDQAFHHLKLPLEEAKIIKTQ
jgi:hypothetical protein